MITRCTMVVSGFVVATISHKNTCFGWVTILKIFYISTWLRSASRMEFAWCSRERRRQSRKPSVIQTLTSPIGLYHLHVWAEGLPRGSIRGHWHSPKYNVEFNFLSSIKFDIFSIQHNIYHYENKIIRLFTIFKIASTDRWRSLLSCCHYPSWLEGLTTLLLSSVS